MSRRLQAPFSAGDRVADSVTGRSHGVVTEVFEDDGFWSFAVSWRDGVSERVLLEALVKRYTSQSKNWMPEKLRLRDVQSGS